MTEKDRLIARIDRQRRHLAGIEQNRAIREAAGTPDRPMMSLVLAAVQTKLGNLRMELARINLESLKAL